VYRASPWVQMAEVSMKSELLVLPFNERLFAHVNQTKLVSGNLVMKMKNTIVT
jgi:hypothetical protein